MLIINQWFKQNHILVSKGQHFGNFSEEFLKNQVLIGS